MKAVVLLSGGLDSTTTLAIAKSQGFDVFCLSFFYGQRNSIEIKSAKEVKNAIAPENPHKIINIDLKQFGSSALTEDDIDVPELRSQKEIESEIPITYVPARNTIFLSYALAYCEILKANDIFIGANILDYSGYPDCRPEYIEAFNKMANLALERTVRGEKINIHTPLITFTKKEIIEKGLELGVDYSKTLSCYNPDEKGSACGKCDPCQFRIKAFSELNLKDPVKYQTNNANN